MTNNNEALMAWCRITKALLHNEQPCSKDLDIVNHALQSNDGAEVGELKQELAVLMGRSNKNTKQYICHKNNVYNPAHFEVVAIKTSQFYDSAGVCTWCKGIGFQENYEDGYLESTSLCEHCQPEPAQDDVLDALERWNQKSGTFKSKPAQGDDEIIYCTLRESEDDIDIECRFKNGEKYSAVVVDIDKPKLAQKICDFLNGKQSLTQAQPVARNERAVDVEGLRKPQDRRMPDNEEDRAFEEGFNHCLDYITAKGYQIVRK